jgi:hypothetical protein
MPRNIYTTEEELKTFMLAELGEVAIECEWPTTAAPAYQTAVNAVLTEAAIDTVDLIAPVRLEMLARVEIWRQVVQSFVTSTNWSGDGLSVGDDKLFSQARAMLDMHMATARRAGLYQTGQSEPRSVRVRANFTF